MLELQLVTKDEKEILRNLVEKYKAEFSQWTLEDVNPVGLFGYDYLDNYWTEENRFPYFLKVDGKLAGFALVNDVPEDADRASDFTLAEFWVLYKYRRQGIGRQAAIWIMNRHLGKWQLMRHPKNLAAVAFWNRVIDEYTYGRYELIENHPKLDYEDGSHADVFYFSNEDRRLK